MTTDDILIFGPYLGSFEQEVVTFRPYITWIKNVLQPKSSYLSTHFNREFMYRGIIDEHCFIPVYKQFSIDELNQEGFIHKDVTQKDFSFFIKELKDRVCEVEGCLKKDVDVRSVKYIKTMQNYPIHNKDFEPFVVGRSEIPEDLKDLLLFIPYGVESEMKFLYKYLRDEFGFSVVGDMNSPLSEYNTILKFPNYLKNGFKYIIGAISHAKAVVCPLSYWTIICNLQGVSVLSWGNNPGLYSKGGIYHFGNPNARILPELNNVKSSISDYLGKNGE